MRSARLAKLSFLALGTAFVLETSALGQGAAPILNISRGDKVDLRWQSEKDFVYKVEFTRDAVNRAWQVLTNGLAGTGGVISINDAGTADSHRFYRLFRESAPSTNTNVISTNVVEPMPGVIYPGGTLFGSPFLGLQFNIPQAWKGGVRQGTSTMLFASDTETGLFLATIALSGDVEAVKRALNGSFQTGTFSGFQLSQPPAASGNKVVVEWIGYGENAGALMRVEALVHPSGGAVLFAGLFTQPNRTTMQGVLNSFVNSTVLVPRQTDTEVMNLITGRAFVWVSSSSAGNGGNSGSLSRWTQNNAFFCAGTYEITTRSESTFSGTLSGGGFYTGGSSSNSTESGDWTVLKTPSGPVIVMASSSGMQSALLSFHPNGRSIYFGDQQFDYAGANNNCR